MTACWGVVPAAGLGRRMNHAEPKQYLTINHLTVIEHSVSPLLNYRLIKKIIIALDKNDQRWHRLTLKDNQQIETCDGGNSRAYSVLNALKYLASQAADDDWVIVHDAVRPCLSGQELARLVEQTWEETVGTILAIAIDDTIKQISNDTPTYVEDTLDRRHAFVRAVTPQMFRYRLLRDAIEQALADGINVVDEATAVSHAGHRVRIEFSTYQNIKITYPKDIEVAKAYFSYHGAQHEDRIRD